MNPYETVLRMANEIREENQKNQRQKEWQKWLENKALEDGQKAERFEDGQDRRFRFKKEMEEVIALLTIVEKYAEKLLILSDQFRHKIISKNEYFESIPITDIYSIETSILIKLNPIFKEQ